MKFNKKVNELLNQMTLKEKIGQMYQAGYFTDVVTGHDYDSSHTVERIKEGMVGSVLSVYDEDVLYILQKTAVEKSRLGIPLLFAFDIIHGYKTSFPINLALSNSWDVNLVERVSKAVAYETAHRGLHLTYSPMLDIVRDPRWGRVMESNGEDPYLSSELAKAYIKGYQQDNLKHPDTIATCAKHFVAYGLSEAGRDYNTVDLSERVLRNIYLPPFKAAINAGTTMMMTGFNTVFDRPATANKFLLKDILRGDLGFDGVVISDSKSTEEIIRHKVAKNLKDVAFQCADAGLEIEMVSESYLRHLEALVNEGKIKQEIIDEAAGHVLMLKDKLGLFENPYSYFYQNSHQYLMNNETIALSQEAAEKSMVLLKNDGILPIKKDKKICLCGPFIDSNDVIGEWAGLTSRDDVTTIAEAFKNDHSLDVTVADDIDSIRSSDVVIMALGEASHEAGEGNSKTNLYLSQDQQAYFNDIYQINPNIVLVIFAGRPLMIRDFDKLAKGIIYAYQPGMQTGPALKNLLMGEVSPSAKLTMTFPYHEGQIPIYYNHYQTGRPVDPNNLNYRYNSHYKDCQNEPLYPFGYGLSYGKFIYSNLRINQQKLTKHDKLLLQIDINNESDFEAEEIVQCYIEALVFSVSRPVNELKRFKRVHFNAGERKTVTFELDINDFRSHNIDMKWTAENQPYKVKIGPSSQDLIEEEVMIEDE